MKLQLTNGKELASANQRYFTLMSQNNLKGKVVQKWNIVHLAGNFWDHGITPQLH